MEDDFVIVPPYDPKPLTKDWTLVNKNDLRHDWIAQHIEQESPGDINYAIYEAIDDFKDMYQTGELFNILWDLLNTLKDPTMFGQFNML